MCKEYAILMDSERVGTAYVVNEGLFYRIRCRCRPVGTKPFRIIVSGEREADLGICVPINDGVGLETRIPMKLVGKGELGFRISVKPDMNSGFFVPLSVDEPFAYLRRLKDARLSYENGKVGFVFKD